MFFFEFAASILDILAVFWSLQMLKKWSKVSPKTAFNLFAGNDPELKANALDSGLWD